MWSKISSTSLARETGTSIGCELSRASSWSARPIGDLSESRIVCLVCSDRSLGRQTESISSRTERDSRLRDTRPRWQILHWARDRSTIPSSPTEARADAHKRAHQSENWAWWGVKLTLALLTFPNHWCATIVCNIRWISRVAKSNQCEAAYAHGPQPARPTGAWKQMSYPDLREEPCYGRWHSPSSPSRLNKTQKIRRNDEIKRLCEDKDWELPAAKSGIARRSSFGRGYLISK